MQVTTNVISDALNSYLSNTRLSMEQIAHKWNISSAMLSQIKNGKKRAGIDLGLKILREAGTNIESRKMWLDDRYMQESQEYGLIKEEFTRMKAEKSLQNDFCELLESHPVLLDIFLDIALAEKTGITWNSIYKNYGEHGADLALTLVESKLVVRDEEKFFINEQNSTFISDDVTSFGIVKAIIELQKTRKKRNIFKGELQYDITDVSKEAYAELIELNKEYVKKVRSILQENEMHRLAGGVRIVCQSLVSLAKGSLCLALFLCVFSQSPAHAGGISGGSSDRLLGGIGGGASDLIRSFKKPSNFTGRFGTKFIYEKATLSIPYLYTDKESAVAAMVELNKSLVEGDFDKKVLRRMRIRPNDNCKSQDTLGSSYIRNALTKGSIHPLGFSLSESFNAKGEQRFSIKADFYVPCEKPKKD